MLILARREGERVFVGDDIILHVIEIRRNKVYLGWQAPDNVKIMRDDWKKGRCDEIRFENDLPQS